MSHAFNTILTWDTSHSGSTSDSGETCSSIHNGVWGSCCRGEKSTETSSLLQPSFRGGDRWQHLPPLLCTTAPKCNHTADDRTKRNKIPHSCFRGCGVSIHGASKAKGTRSWATCSGCACLSRGVGPEDPQRSLPDSSILCHSQPFSAILCDPVPWF